MIMTNNIGSPNFHYDKKDFILCVQSWAVYRKAPKSSKFDDILRSRWQHAMNNGAFNYTFTEKEEHKRVIPGKEKYFTVLSPNRGNKRRAPEYIESVNKPFNPEKFHFNKVKPAEILMNFCPSEKCPSGEGHDDTVQNGKLEESCSRHQVIINNSPFAIGHCLLVPNVSDCVQQMVTFEGLKLAIEMMLLSSHPGFRIGFNGLCALASVNHQHVHGWYLDHQLRVEYAPVKPLAGPCHQIVDMPSEGFVFQLHGSSVDKLSRAVFAVTNYFQTNDIAHNMLLTRGVVFGEPADSENTTIRIYLWPRKHYIGEKALFDEVSSGIIGIFNTAVAELGGHIVVYVADQFETLTEAEIKQHIQSAMLPAEEFKHISDTLKSLMEPHSQETR